MVACISERARASLIQRMAVYCSERFPLPAYGLITALFTASGLSLSSALRAHAHFSGWQYAVAFLVTFALFFQLRVADEHKDHQDDCRFAPERPVPRGLVSLTELRAMALALALSQILFCLMLKPVLLIYLAMVWAYFALMSREFFLSAFLRRRPILYMLSHMFILVLSDLFITAVDFAGSSAGASPYLLFFLCGSFANGMVIELGRKIKAPDQERKGIDTYSKALGIKPAATLFLASLLWAQIALTLALPGHTLAAWVLFAAVDLALAAIIFKFTHKPDLKGQKLIEGGSGIAVCLSYLTVSLICLL
jgi:4-hydroxybenzoate polyprenyltransferase